MATRSGRIPRPRQSFVESSPPRSPRKGISPPRSPARTKKSSPPARSPSRKSPARKSPGRKLASKYPARKSPSRATKEKSESVPKSPAKRPVVTNVEVRLEDLKAKIDSYRTTYATQTEYSVNDISKLPQTLPDTINGLELLLNKRSYGLRNRKSVEPVVPRRSNRLREYTDTVPDIRRSISKSVSHSKSLSKSISQSIDTFSDGDNSEEDFQKEKSQSVTRQLATPLRDSFSVIGNRWEFGGRIGSAALIILLPLTVFTILLSCSKLCSITPVLDGSAFKSFSLWFGSKAFFAIFTQYLIQAIFAVISILGKNVKKYEHANERFCSNAFASSIFTITVLFTLDYLKIFNSNTLLNEYLRLAMVSYGLSTILAVILYVKSRKVGSNYLNPNGSTGYVLYDFWIGREIHPCITKLDVKIWVSRISNITALILAILIFKHGLLLPVKDIEGLLENYKEYVSKIQLKPTALLYSMMQIIYLLNFIMKEEQITSTFFWQYEGMGYLQVVSSALYPFYFTSISKFIVDTNLTLSTNILMMASVLYLLGFFIMLLSNNIKHHFRTNPLYPNLTHLDSMPTFHGKKLLISNMWGVLRHPNYTGDILIHIALSVPGICSGQLIASAPALLTIAALLHRAWRDHARCKRRYGAAWQRYCNKVPSVVIPKIL